MENGEWRIGNGELGIENWELRIGNWWNRLLACIIESRSLNAQWEPVCGTGFQPVLHNVN
ncbi:MAG: hypothetical protein F6J86_41225 [Symploca sp. SIO1B1]|nr:hypothetical protein [Symploca sp. SIO1B1]